MHSHFSTPAGQNISFSLVTIFKKTVGSKSGGRTELAGAAREKWRKRKWLLKLKMQKDDAL
jgi:hypothetical protein